MNGIRAMLARTDPGPGGICWNAASRETAKYFKTGGSWQEDPELRTMAVRSTDLTGVQSGCFEKDLSFRLVAGNGAEIHGELKKGRTQYEFALTPDMYADGVLKLAWIPCGHYSGVSLNELMLFAQ
ncbi:MAG: hypothetical protein PUA83_09890 [Clostridiales bacterium]|nr:hypothetical protein [Clostridiales bacterium]